MKKLKSKLVYKVSIFFSIGCLFFISNAFAVTSNVCIDFKPDALNINSCGKWVTVYIEPGDYDPADIDPSTILLNGQIQPALDHQCGFVADNASCLVDRTCELDVIERMVKFNRDGVAAILSLGEEVGVLITGKFNDGTPFEGTDVIQVTDNGYCCADFNSDGIVSGADLDLLEAEYYVYDCDRTASNPVPPGPGCCRADGNDDSIVSTPDLDLFEAEYYQLCPYSNPCPNVPVP